MESHINCEVLWFKFSFVMVLIWSSGITVKQKLFATDKKSGISILSMMMERRQKKRSA